MSGCKNQQDAADDREVERILNMTEAELIAEAGGRDPFEGMARKAREALKAAIEEAERRVGKPFNPKYKPK